MARHPSPDRRVAISERRVAVVTGAGRGIGAAVARLLAARGDRVLCVDRCEEDPRLEHPLATRAELDAVVADCGEGAEVVVLDVADRDAVLDALGSLERVDVVVCAAGVLWGGAPLWETPPEAWQAMAGVNVEGVLHVAAATIPLLLAAPEPRTGRFVAVASAAGTRGLPGLGAYSATKHAVIGLVRSLAADLADSGVTANAVAPGATDTELLSASAAVYALDDVEDFAVHHPIGRVLQPEEVAAAVLWLTSTEASGVTASVLAVDGGMTAV